METSNTSSILERVSREELITLCATDSDLYCQTFFPETFRQRSPLFHRDMWDLLEDRQHRHVGIEVFRGGAKTTTLRAYASKRIAYGISRTVVFLSAAQEHSKRNLAWLKRRIEHFPAWAQTYGLQKGDKWTDEFIEIYHAGFGFSISVLALGLTGQTRGINIDDWRPDLIVADDICDEENVGTPEQRQKTEDRFFGSITRTLAPASEAPDAKLVMLQTPLDKADIIAQCKESSNWATRSYGCFGPDGESIWPSRWSTESLLKEKESYIELNKLPIWLREMECKIVDDETSAFRSEWLKYWDVLPPGMTVVIGIDPVPPPRETGILLRDTDYEVLCAVGKYKDNFYLLDYVAGRGHEPDWTVSKFFELVEKWKPLKARVEGVAYQRTLRWILAQGMDKRKRWLQIDLTSDDKRKKSHRIKQAFSGIASNGKFFVSSQHHEFVTQFTSYPNVSHDDVLDSVAMALDGLMNIPVENDEYEGQEEELAPLVGWRSAP